MMAELIRSDADTALAEREYRAAGMVVVTDAGLIAFDMAGKLQDRRCIL